MIPYGRQHISEGDIESVVNILRSDFLTQGTVVPQFEKSIADYVGAKYAVAVNSGTSALHIACLALELGEGDTLWTTPITFVASANCALYCQANVDFVDIDPNTFNISIPALENKLKIAAKENTLPKIVVPVHMGGEPCEMEAIYKLSQQYNFKIIEDACHAIGGHYKDKPIGQCQYSNITVFSFHPVKNMTTGEGGIATTNSPILSKRMNLLRSHGITRDPQQMKGKSDGVWYYQQVALGFNYRMTDFQAALGLSQLTKLNQFIERRHAIAHLYDQLLEELPVKSQNRSSANSSGLHLYLIRLHTKRINQTHQAVFNAMRERGISVNIHYIPIHLQPYYRELGFRNNDFPEAERYYQQAITLPLYPDLTDQQIHEVVNTLREILL